MAFRLSAFVVASMPMASLFWAIATDSLGPDPGKALTRDLGLAAFQLLLATLAMTPLQRLTRLSAWIRIRRMLGLYTFLYGVIHLLAFLQFIAGWRNLAREVIERPFITLGFTALLLLAPLALTSTKAMMRRLGKRWKHLHMLIYPIALLGWVHFFWQARSDLGEILLYGLLLVGLLGFRLPLMVRSYQRLVSKVD